MESMGRLSKTVNSKSVLGVVLVITIILSVYRIQWSMVSTEKVAKASNETIERLMELPILPANKKTAPPDSVKKSQQQTPTNPSPNLQDHSEKANPTSWNYTTFAACLLVKDDNDILNEWIAYHYHVLNLRQIVLAVDPASATSPSTLLDRWRQRPFSMVIQEWTDTDYMPEDFLKGKYDQVPSFLPAFVRANTSASIWHSKEQHQNATTQEIEADLVAINNHRFRQVTFVSRCFENIQKTPPPGPISTTLPLANWVVHIDTDEYIVVNPRLRARPNAVGKGGVIVPQRPLAGSVMTFLEEMFLKYPKRINRHCLMMPTIMFGNITDNTTKSAPAGWDPNRFETLRWTHHADFDDIANGLQKAIVDVASLQPNHPIFVQHRIKSVHQPLDDGDDYEEQIWKQTDQTCRQMSLKPDVDAVRLYPLTTNHYLGSLDRYLSRQDVRRNEEIYRKKARVNGGVDDGWIQGWLSSFVDMHGEEATRHVLELEG